MEKKCNKKLNFSCHTLTLSKYLRRSPQQFVIECFIFPIFLMDICADQRNLENKKVTIIENKALFSFFLPCFQLGRDQLLYMGQTRQKGKRPKNDYFCTSACFPDMTLFILRLKMVSIQRILHYSTECPCFFVRVASFNNSL